MNEQKTKIYEAVTAVMKKINAIGKDRKNQQQGFAYRGIDDVMNELHPILAECGMFIVPEVIKEERTERQTKTGAVLFYSRQTIRFTFFADDGSNIIATVIGEGMDSGDKASNKALSIGFKYACLQVFCIPTEDDKDPDAVTPEPVEPSTPQVKGGESTPWEKQEISRLLAGVHASGAPVFTLDDKKAYSAMRKEKTAQELITCIKQDLQKRITAANGNAPQDLY